MTRMRNSSGFLEDFPAKKQLKEIRLSKEREPD
jgi:hypothetical protein